MNISRAKFYLELKKSSHKFGVFLFSSFLILTTLQPLASHAATIPSTWTLIAAGQRSVIFSVTAANATNLNNGSYFYYNSSSMGFAPNSTISQSSADIKSSSNDGTGCSAANLGDLRLSWHGYATGTINGGWRVGCSTGLNSSMTAVRAIYQSNSPSYYPSGPTKNVSAATVTGGGWTNCWNNYYGETTASGAVLSACTGTYLLLAGFDGQAAIPAISSSATISGTTTYGSALSSTTGTWTNSPTSYSYRWSRSATSGGTYTAISGATSSSYTLVAADVGQYLKVAVTATNADGSATDTSTATAAIAAKALTIKAADKSASYTGSSVSVTNSYSITAGALVGSDTFTALTYTYTSVSPSYNSTTAPTAAGTYTITPSAASFSVGSAASYLITYDTATLTISSVSSSATITVAVGTLTYRTTKSISAVASVAGKLTFKANNTTISGCKNLAANSGNSFTRSCSYKPSTRGYVTISVTLVPTDTSYNSSVTKSDTYFVYQRSGSR